MGKVSLSLIFMLFSINLLSQDLNESQDKYLEAEYFLLKEDYSDALSLYQQLYEKAPENSNLAYSIGVCLLNINGRKNLSVEYLEKATKNMTANHKEGTLKETSAPYDALFELAKAYRVNFMFSKAKDAFRRYSQTLLPDDKENLDFVHHEIEVCDMAQDLVSKPVSFTEENLGELFNDEKSNFDPVISSDNKTLVWITSLKFYDAIMYSRVTNGKWSAPVNITPELQVDGQVYVSGLSADGNELFFSKHDENNSDIYSSRFDGKSWSKAEKLNKNVNTRYWESQASITDDGNKLIFSSDRPGGFGGLDLYISEKVNGDWGPAVNLGPEINTEFNEDRPFLVNNGATLFFASQGHQNMGGYDIFHSDLQSNMLWGKPVNIGYPINTPDDNLFFCPSRNGTVLYLSLLKNPGGSGNEDLFRITLK